jgi:hypothetical protein
MKRSLGKDPHAANLVIQRYQWWSGQNDRDGSDHDCLEGKFL